MYKSLSTAVLALFLASSASCGSHSLVSSSLGSGSLVNSHPLTMSYALKFDLEYGTHTFSGMKDGDNQWKHFSYGLNVQSYISGQFDFEFFHGYQWNLNAKFYPFYVEPFNFKTRTLRFEAMTDAMPFDVEYTTSYTINFLKAKTEITENTKVVKESIFDALKNMNIEYMIPYVSDFFFDDDKFQSKYFDPYWQIDLSKKFLKLDQASWYGNDKVYNQIWLLGNY
eukprot:403335873